MQIFLRAGKISCRINPCRNCTSAAPPWTTCRRSSRSGSPRICRRTSSKAGLTEFQIVEADGKFAGAIGVQIVRQHARLHSEDYSDFAVADAARELFWERIQKLAANHGVFRVWMQEDFAVLDALGISTGQRGNPRAPAGRMEKSRRPPWRAGAKQRPLAHAGTEKRGRHQRRAAKPVRRLHGGREKIRPRTVADAPASSSCLSPSPALRFSSSAWSSRAGCSCTGGDSAADASHSAMRRRRVELVRVIGTAHHRPAGDVDKTHRFRPPLVITQISPAKQIPPPADASTSAANTGPA